jgi:hypothetical protein
VFRRHFGPPGILAELNMNVRSAILLIVLGIPAVALLAFGPRGQVNVPPGRTVIRYWEKWTGV